MTFSDLGLSPETLRAIDDVGYDTPTPIQEQAIPVVLQGRDVLGIAQTGTGKTASFTLPMIDILAAGRAKARMPRSLIVAPTRELAAQVAENFTLYGKYHKLNMALLIGGESFKDQVSALDKGVDVLIATPGRLLDLFDRGRILLTDVKILVIDEADRMLDMGFIPDVERIVSLLPKMRQTLFFSATMDAQIGRLADAFLQNPKEVRVSPKQSSAATVVQQMAIVEHEDKRRALRELLNREDVRNAFIFCNRKRDVAILYKSLSKHGYDVVQLHGDMPQNERTVTLERFKKNEARLMVCSDVAARGIDVSDVSHVFNFDVPSHSEDYVHRIGRTGRAGKEGHAYTLATPDDTKYVDAIEKLIGKEIPRVQLETVENCELAPDDGRKRRRRPAHGKDKDRGRDRDQRRREPSRGGEAPAAAAAVAPSAPAEAAPVAPAPVPAAAVEPKREESRDEPRREARDDRRRDRGDRPERGERSDRGDRNGRDRDRDRDRRGGRGRRDHPAWEVEEMEHGPDALAFGAHTPAFILVDPVVEGERLRIERERREAEAEKRRAAREAAAADEAASVAADDTDDGDAGADDAAVTIADAAADGAAGEPRKRRRTRRRGKGDRAEGDTAAMAVTAAPQAPEQPELAADTPVPAEPVVEVEATAAAAAEQVAEAAAAQDAVTDAEGAPAATPKRKRAPAARKAPAAKKPAARTAAPRSRKKAAEPAAAAEGAAPEAAAAGEAEAAPKPKRTRVRKTTTAEGTTETVEKAPAKRRAPRKKPAAAAAAAGETAAAEPVPPVPSSGD
ncbi:DEAD/DEAH box helicase [Caenispirillum bisanense]|uniref:DEAD/DEAH box helicase n=1 Tax=Caenispirillum bisanense TaxID=414052 RepID=UPI0031D0199C